MTSRNKFPLPALSIIIILAAAPGCATAVSGGGERYSASERSSFYVPVRDGTRLAVNIYRPAAGGRGVEEPLPTIVVFTAYRPRHLDNDGKIAEAFDAGELGVRHRLAH